MSTRTADQAVLLSRPYPTLAQLRAEILTDEALPLRRRQDIASACRSLAQALGQPLDAILAEPRQLRAALQGLTPAMAGLAPGRWRNILSLLRHALGHLGLITVPGRYQVQPSPAWAALLPQLPAYGDRYVLARFARYCTQSGLEPAQVDDAVLTTYLQDLEAQSLDQDPKRMQRDTAVKWNKAAERLPDWPQQRLAVADNRNTYALPWERFPASLRDDVQAWLDWLGGADPLAERDFRPLRPTSVASRKRQLHEYLSALVLQGEDPAEMPDLARVVTPTQAGKALRFFWDRAGGKPSVHAGQVTGVVLTIARHWAKLPADDIAEIKRMGKRIALHHDGMTPRNRARLRAVEDPTRRDALLLLPEQLRAEVVREKAPTVHLAQRLQTAVAVELLTMAPIRLKNLAELRLGTTLLRDHQGRMTIVLPESATKNHLALEIALPPSTARLVDLYCKSYRPLLGGGDWLFPGRTPAGHKSHDGLRSQIAKAIAERCGLVFNPHLFRHFSATLILQDNPGAHGQVQRILGHKTLKTAMTYYTGLETKAAFQHYDQQVLQLRGGASGLLPRRRRAARRGDR
ncbi:hypothetical protein EBE87_23045 [Pseudoroseomonas wenyumeiae]|uniref:Tyr recombinase domain-containing protein n=1 Tax=Teichococcus wenyumeiae TaxID=2478470 RepID=A0A3A9JV70_9PROT|nr:site-specific integrase [Pseudoroseomonas wenyumeiae]RKK04688.1 hypothetical protein D6Z83_08265 [Pseudoroseomonas wenyumeiae]RMI17309.1 hypothetical protein EBE87_23045 [Pseudoroseomonas wenyumeiae]